MLGRYPGHFRAVGLQLMQLTVHTFSGASAKVPGIACGFQLE